VINEFVQTYNAERKKLAKASNRERAAIERRIGAINRENTRLIEAIKAGAGTALTMIVETMNGLADEKAKLTADLAAMNIRDNVVSIHPRAIERYQRAIAELGDESKRASPEEFGILRSLIKSVTVCTNAGDGSASIEIKGAIAALVECGSVVGSGGGTRTPDPRIMIPGMATDTGRQTATGRLDKSPKTLKFFSQCRRLSRQRVTPLDSR
jgi:site-specific DNA recombinase